MEFVNAAISLCVASGIGGLYATSGVSIQDGYRRETGAETIAVFRQTGGQSLPFDTSEGYGLQVLVDSKTVSGARAVSRGVYNLLHNRLAEVISGISVLWVRGVAPPQDVGPGPGTGERFAVSTNYEARILR